VPLGLSVDDAAAGVIELFEETLTNEAVGRILGKGYSPADYALLCYGGAGPLHAAGYPAGVTFRMQYFGRLNDIEIVSPRLELKEGEHVDELIAAFEDAYAKVYARSARSPERGYLVTQAIVTGSVDVEKPALPSLGSSASAQPKASRAVHWGQGFVDTDVYELEAIAAGQEIEGPAVLESQATTFATPPGRRATLDRHQVFHLT
jgi:N-methylhydantoinase A/oxoprolinase/acetone carboxylase beta subunit